MKSVTFDVYSGRKESGEELTKLFTKTLSQGIVKIGNLPSNHLVIKDNDVARMHCVLEEEDDGLYVLDLGAPSGVIVNGSKVSRRRLNTGDEVVLGSATVVISFE